MDEVQTVPQEVVKKKYRVNVKGVGKMLLKVALVVVGLYLALMTYITFTNSPQKVRITNLTGRSATVSWVTKYPSKGEVVFGENDKFAFGPFAGSSKEKSYDDRDYAYAQLEQMQDIIDLRSQALDVEDVTVKKQGRYYVHHVTVLGLDENTKYSFKVGNGTMWWDVSSSDQQYYEYEAPTISEFWFNTLNDPESLLGPNPAYGRVYTMEDNDGFLTDNPSTDAIVFSYATRQLDDEVSMILSSVTNLKGGWTIDKANFRDLNGLSTTFEQGEDNLYVYAQFENLLPREGVNLVYGVDDNPAPAIVANGETDIRSEQASVKRFMAKVVGFVSADLDMAEEIYIPPSNPPAPEPSNKEEDPGKGLEDFFSGGGDTLSGFQNNNPSVETSKDEEVVESTTDNFVVPENLKGCGSSGCNENDCYCPSGDGEWTKVNGGCRPKACENPYRNVEGIKGAADPYFDNYTNGDGNICDPKFEVAKGKCSEGGEITSCTDGGNNNPVYSGCKDPEVDSNKEPEDGGGGSVSLVEPEDGEIEAMSSDDPLDNDFETPSGNQVLFSALGDYTKMDNGDGRCDSHQIQYRKDVGSYQGSIYCFDMEDLQLISYLTKDFSCGSSRVKVKRDYYGGGGSNYNSGKTNLDVDLGNCGSNSVCDHTYGLGGCKEVALPGSDDRYTKQEFEECKSKTGKTPLISSLGEFICTDNSGVEGMVRFYGAERIPESNIVTKTYAADITPEIDETFVYFPSDGLYEVFFDGSSVGKRLALEKDGELYYIDRDGFPGYLMPANYEDVQDDEDLIFDPTSVEITASKIAENFQVELKEGVNIVSFPFVPMNGEDTLRASDLMGYTNTSYIRIEHITFFEDGKWKPGYHALSTDETTNSGEDFVLTMGKGYLIIADEDMLGDNALQVPGRALESEIPIAFKPGWNLIGVHGYIQSYSARTLLDSVNTLDGITSDNVTWWPTSKGRYEGFQKSEGIEYGFDYPIVKDLGYFVRVSDFEPEDPNTKSVIWAPGTDVHNTAGNN